MEIKKKAGAAGERLNSALDPASAEEFSDAMKRTAGSIEAVSVKAKHMHGLIFKTLSTVRQLEPLIRLFERKPPLIEQRGAYERKVARGGDAVRGFLRSIPLDREGRPDTRAMDAGAKEELKKYATQISLTKNKDLDKMVDEISGRGGVAGAIDRWKTRRALQGAAKQVLAGGEIEGGAEATLGRVVAGGGSWTGGLEAIAGGVSGADVVTGVLYAMKKTFDMMVESNKDIFEKIGTSGGLFGGRRLPALPFRTCVRT